MSTLDFDLDTQMNHLEHEWRRSYQASIVARTDYQSLVSCGAANTHQLHIARERLDGAEALKARIMAKIERLEDTILGHE